jgi:hypothetical protein
VSGICNTFFSAFSALGLGVRGVLALAIIYSLTSRQWCGHHTDATIEGLHTSSVAGNIHNHKPERLWNCPQQDKKISLFGIEIQHAIAPASLSMFGRAKTIFRRTD